MFIIILLDIIISQIEYITSMKHHTNYKFIYHKIPKRKYPYYDTYDDLETCRKQFKPKLKLNNSENLIQDFIKFDINKEYKHSEKIILNENSESSYSTIDIINEEDINNNKNLEKNIFILEDINIKNILELEIDTSYINMTLSKSNQKGKIYINSNLDKTNNIKNSDSNINSFNNNSNNNNENNDNNNNNKKNFRIAYINENLYPLVRNNLNINPINLNRVDDQGDGNC